KVFDRWGRPVYNADAPAEGWDGSDESGSISPEGVYFYDLRIGTKAFNGSITLLR
ncbi:MAG: gliding motility-associated C-terminal domain-containing protein, partial [Bacteroidota bacterium]